LQGAWKRSQAALDHSYTRLGYPPWSLTLRSLPTRGIVLLFWNLGSAYREHDIDLLVENSERAQIFFAFPVWILRSLMTWWHAEVWKIVAAINLLNR
jgi:hypothetical protein